MKKQSILETLKGNERNLKYSLTDLDFTLTLERLGATILTNLPNNTGLLSSDSLDFQYLSSGTGFTPLDITKIATGLSAKRLTGVIGVPSVLLQEMREDANIYLENLIKYAIDVAIFNAAIAGNGIEEPEGLYSTITTNVNTTSTAPTWAIITDLEKMVRKGISQPKKLTYISDVDIFMACKTTKKDASSGIFLVDGTEMNGYEFLSSKDLPALDAGLSHPLILGDFSHMVVGIMDEIEIIVDQATLISKGMLQLTVNVYNDIKVTNEKAFAIASKLSI